MNWQSILKKVPEGYREAAGCVVFKGDKVLLLRRSTKETSMHGMYELPGGKLEENETPKETAIVETQEEAGIRVSINKTLVPHTDDGMKKVYHGFTASVSEDVEPVLSEEHDEYKWITIEDALTMKEPLSHHAEFLFGQLKGSE